MQVLSVVAINFAEVRKKFEKKMRTEVDTKAISEGIIAFTFLLYFVWNEALIKKGGSYFFMYKCGLQLSVTHFLERF